jgi:hypothetical protein
MKFAIGMVLAVMMFAIGLMRALNGPHLNTGLEIMCGAFVATIIMLLHATRKNRHYTHPEKKKIILALAFGIVILPAGMLMNNYWVACTIVAIGASAMLFSCFCIWQER